MRGPKCEASATNRQDFIARRLKSAKCDGCAWETDVIGVGHTGGCCGHRDCGTALRIRHGIVATCRRAVIIEVDDRRRIYANGDIDETNRSRSVAVSDRIREVLETRLPRRRRIDQLTVEPKLHRGTRRQGHGRSAGGDRLIGHVRDRQRIALHIPIIGRGIDRDRCVDGGRGEIGVRDCC